MKLLFGDKIHSQKDGSSLVGSEAHNQEVIEKVRNLVSENKTRNKVLI